mmetsp:Transcript_7606/g.23166  ORF Transcript_7606/g.23166 Transcript_7606/m.23166 type:complete len:223 (-) Transcript_7606:792-1460(-)
MHVLAPRGVRRGLLGTQGLCQGAPRGRAERNVCRCLLPAMPILLRDAALGERYDNLLGFFAQVNGQVKKRMAAELSTAAKAACKGHLRWVNLRKCPRCSNPSAGQPTSSFASNAPTLSLPARSWPSRSSFRSSRRRISRREATAGRRASKILSQRSRQAAQLDWRRRTGGQLRQQLCGGRQAGWRRKDSGRAGGQPHAGGQRRAVRRGQRHPVRREDVYPVR